jgi:hypothetical protein
MVRDSQMIPDKRGRMIDIHECPGGWKITPYQRDRIYQKFLAQFPDKDWESERASAWIRLEAKKWSLSSNRVRAFIREAVQSERGELERSWAWWVGCSLASSKAK